MDNPLLLYNRIYRGVVILNLIISKDAGEHIVLDFKEVKTKLKRSPRTQYTSSLKLNLQAI